MRMVTVCFTRKEGKTSEDCPIVLIIKLLLLLLNLEQKLTGSCACQGDGGASYSFGWSRFGNLCKFCKSRPSLVHKFKLTEKKNETSEGYLANICEELMNFVAPVYAKLAPESF